MVVVDTSATNSTLGSTEWTWDIFYTFSDVYLAIVITIGVSLNSMAMSLLIRFNKVNLGKITYHYPRRTILIS